MKRTFVLLAGMSLLIAPGWAQGNRDREGEGRGRTADTPSTSVNGSTGDTRRISRSQPPANARRVEAQAPSNRGQAAATTRTDLLRSNNSPDPRVSQMAVRSASRDRDDRRELNRDRDRDGRDWDRDRDRDRGRDWGRSRHHRPPTTVFRNWDRNRIYSWDNRRWRWHGGTWVIYETGPTVVSGRSLVAQVQRELQREGYDPGPADGVAGSKTRRAIAAFQRNHGLRPTGEINSALLRALDIG